MQWVWEQKNPKMIYIWKCQALLLHPKGSRGDNWKKTPLWKKAPPCLNLVILRNSNMDLKSRSPSQTITTTKNTTPLIVVSKIRNERQIDCQKLRKIKTDSPYFFWLHEEYLSYDIDFSYTLSSNLWLVISKRKL